MRLIDADALMGRIIQRSHALITPNGKAGYLGLFIKDIQLVVDTAPTINPDDIRPRGEWITVYELMGGREVCRCPNCKGDEEMLRSRHKPYCPNCGAVMDGKEQGNE